MTAAFMRLSPCEEIEINPPNGWFELPSPGGFCDTFGPVYGKSPTSAEFAIGFRCMQRHLNPSRYCHGGALAAFCDMQAYGVQHILGYETAVVPTISFHIEYLAIVNHGEWVCGDIEILRASRNLVFTQMRCRVDDRLVMNVNAMFKRMAMQDLADRSYFDMIGPAITSRIATTNPQASR